MLTLLGPFNSGICSKRQELKNTILQNLWGKSKLTRLSTIRGVGVYFFFKKKEAGFVKLWYFMTLNCLLRVLLQHWTKRFLLADKFKHWAQSRCDWNFVFISLNAKEFVFALTSIQPKLVRARSHLPFGCVGVCQILAQRNAAFLLALSTFESVCRRHLRDHFEMFIDQLFLSCLFSSVLFVFISWQDWRIKCRIW